MMLSLDTAYRSFGGEVEASSTPTICRLSDSPRHQLSAIAPAPPAITYPADTQITCLRRAHDGWQQQLSDCPSTPPPTKPATILPIIINLEMVCLRQGRQLLLRRD